MRHSIYILLLIAAHQTFAAKPVITNITGVSGAILTGTPFQAFGGFAGDPTACSALDGSTVCDSCTGTTGLVACNPARAYNTLRFTVTATHTDPGNLIMVRSTTDNFVLSTPPHNSTTVAAEWGAVCGALGTGNTADCESPANTSKEGNIRVCVDKDLDNVLDTGEECEEIRVKFVRMEPNTYDVADPTAGIGIVNFTPYPGDEKIYIEDLDARGGFPSLPHGGKASSVRVYIGENNMTEAVPGRGLTPVDLPITGEGTKLDKSVVDGLTNGKPYWFRIAIRDEAGNLGYFWPTTAYTDSNSKNCDTEACKYTATPDEVVGLLTEDMNCFIATAAYGTSFNEKLDTFREFRFKRLLTSPWGREFVKAYYHYGPYAARFIHDKPSMRAAARVMLWPAYGFSRLALELGLAWATVLSLFAMTFAIALPLFGVRRFISRA